MNVTQNYLPFMNKNIRCFETSYDFHKNNKGKTIYSLDNRKSPGNFNRIESNGAAGGILIVIR